MGGAVAVIGEPVPFFTEVLRPEEHARRVPDQGCGSEFLSGTGQPSTGELPAVARAFAQLVALPRTGRCRVL